MSLQIPTWLSKNHQDVDSCWRLPSGHSRQCSSGSRRSYCRQSSHHLRVQPYYSHFLGIGMGTGHDFMTRNKSCTLQDSHSLWIVLPLPSFHDSDDTMSMTCPLPPFHYLTATASTQQRDVNSTPSLNPTLSLQQQWRCDNQQLRHRSLHTRHSHRFALTSSLSCSISSFNVKAMQLHCVIVEYWVGRGGQRRGEFKGHATAQYTCAHCAVAEQGGRHKQLGWGWGWVYLSSPSSLSLLCPHSVLAHHHPHSCLVLNLVLQLA